MNDSPILKVKRLEHLESILSNLRKIQPIDLVANDSALDPLFQFLAVDQFLASAEPIEIPTNRHPSLVSLWDLTDPG